MSWGDVKLGDYISLTGGYAFKSGDFQEEGIPLIRIGSANSGIFKTDGMPFLPFEYKNIYSKFLVKPNDLLITLTGTVGKGDYGNICVASSEHADYLLNQRVARINIESEAIDGQYVQRFLSTSAVKNKITGLSRGVRQANLKYEDILDLEIPLPYPEHPEKSLKEQKRIAAILDKSDGIRRKRKQAIQLADDFLRSVFLDMFGDPVTNPKGWEVKPLGEMFKLSSGSGLTAKDMDSFGAYPVYGGNGINGRHSEYMFESPQLMIGRVGVYCGAIHITEENAWITDNGMYVKEYYQDVNMHYLAQLLELANLNQYAGKAAQPLVSGNRIYPLEMIFPPIDEQDRFENIKHQYLDSTKNSDINRSKVNDLFSSLNQKAFKGEL